MRGETKDRVIMLRVGMAQSVARRGWRRRRASPAEHGELEEQIGDDDHRADPQVQRTG